MYHVAITTSTMGFRVGVSPVGIIKGTPYSITDYSRKFEHRKWDSVDRCWVFINEYFYYSKEKEICYFPLYDLNTFTSFLSDRHVTFDIIEGPTSFGRDISYHMLPHVSFKNDKQKNAVEYLTDPKSGPIRGVALQTGSGKTTSVIWGIQLIGKRALISMTSRMEQWASEFKSYTTIDDDDIYTIQGVGSLTKLFDQIDKKIFPKIILASAKTLRLYLDYGPSYQHLPHPSEACEILGLGIVGTDEYHEHFYTNYLIGILLNPQIFIPITATFVANDPFVKTIFDQFIPKSTQFVGGEYDKFVKVTAYRYMSGGYHIRPYHYTRKGMYSQVSFEEFLLSKKGEVVFKPFIETGLIPIIAEHYIDICQTGERCLILCATKAMCDELEGILKRHFRDKKISVFYTGKSLTVLSSYDIIISTPGSAGTGRDIKNLRTCVVLDNTNSEIRNLQYIGRLRGPPQMMNTPEFVTISFKSIPPHEKYYQVRSMLYGPRALKFEHRRIT